MLLICDSGSTKADWCLVDKDNKRTFFATCGMNPYNISLEAISQEIESVLMSSINPKDVHQLKFYGAGCSAEVKKKELKDLFSTYFTNAKIYIDHDLLGAARALCGKEKGLCAILGTGSNSCLYDGEDIRENVPALGYVLCDEGAGTNIGKLILRNYLRHLLPKDLEKEFATLYPGQESDFLNRLYKGSVPNYFLASFAKFVTDRKDNEYCRNLIKECFVSFFENQVVLYSDYTSYKINVVGSVGFICKDIFKEVALNYGQEVGKFIKAPLVDLVDFHFYLD
ncbi:MAG TPA: N-acetylglucosamine kinase [Bacteroidales bacterium]|nr:N-acetylglucosamine kinase [Bacteroidales bacterium]